MPPKSKFNKDEIIDAAVAIIEREGESALTARALGCELNSSARPIFTVFGGMDEVLNEAITRAKALYTSYVDSGLNETPAFKGVGKAYIRFASEHKRLFMLLFMRERGDRANDIMPNSLDANADRILKSITDGYDVSEDIAKKLYRHLWLYTHGIAVLIATGVGVFSPQEISDMMTEVFVSLIKNYSTGESV